MENTSYRNIRFGACSWNYASWVGLVYSTARKTAAEYLGEYAAHFSTAEIDSWFYRIPPATDVQAYKDAVGADFRFTCKAPQALTLTHHRKKAPDGTILPNDDFLSRTLFERFIAAIDPLLPQIDAIILEFEYLNKQKMASLDMFQNRLASFINQIPQGLPLAIESRNANYLLPSYFRYLGEMKLIPVFSEKMYMPHIYEVHAKIKDLLQGPSVVRLMGGDRAAIEELTGERWDRIVDEKSDKEAIAAMLAALAERGPVICNINNHYEGCAPLTIQAIQAILEKSLDKKQV